MAFIKDGMKRREPNLTYDPNKYANLTEEELLELQRLEAEMARLRSEYRGIKKALDSKSIKRKG
jgi:cell shape-determining protein MreC